MKRRPYRFACLSLTALLALQLALPSGAHSPAVLDLLRLGDQAMEGGRLPEAAKIYQEALQMEPDSPDAHNQLGLCYSRQNLLLEAAGEFRKALDANPKFLPSLNNMGSVMYRKGNYDSAIEYYEKALAQKTEDPEVLTNLASVYRDRATFVGGQRMDNDFKQSIDLYHRALAIDPDFPQAHNNLGLCELRLRHFDTAEAEINKAVRIKKDYAAAYFNLGLVEQAKGQNQQAIQAFQTSLRYEKVPAYAEGTRRKIAELGVGQTNDTTDHFHAAYDLISKKQWKQAEDELQKALSGSGTTDAVAWNNMGVVLTREGRYRDAIAALKKAVSLRNGKFAQAQYNLGQAQFRTGDLAGAESSFRHAIAESQGAHALAHNALGMVLKQKGDAKKALSEYRLAIMQSGDTLPVVHYNIGLLLEQSGKRDEAIQEFRSYIAQSPDGVNVAAANERIASLR